MGKTSFEMSPTLLFYPFMFTLLWNFVIKVSTFLVKNGRVPGVNSKLCMGSLVSISLKITDIPSWTMCHGIGKVSAFLIYFVPTNIDFPIDFNGIQDSRIKQVFAWVRVCLLYAWFATLVWIHHALWFQILCIYTKAPGATLKVGKKSKVISVGIHWQRYSCKLHGWLLVVTSLAFLF